MSRLRLLFSMFVLAFTLQAFVPTLAWADDDDHEGEEVPETSEPKEENPIDKILEMMREVEDRLIDSDSGEWTQQEEEAIIEALENQDDVIDALTQLIKKAEHQGGT